MWYIKGTPCTSRLLLLFVVFLLLGNCWAISIDVALTGRNSAEVAVWLDAPADASQTARLMEYAEVINQQSPEQISATPVSENHIYSNTGLLIKIKDLHRVLDMLNFVDFNYTRSFFKEKYYLKLLLNEGLFQSDIFKQLQHHGQDEQQGEISIGLIAPGGCLETNMDREGSQYRYALSLSGFYGQGGVAYIQTARFIPETYFTIFAIFLLLLAVVSVLMRKTKRNESEKISPR